MLFFFLFLCDYYQLACEGNYFDYGLFSTHISTCIYGGGGDSEGIYQIPKRIPETIDLRSTSSFSALASVDGSTVGDLTVVDHQNSAGLFSAPASVDDSTTGGDDVIDVDVIKTYKPKQQQTITGFFNRYKSVNARTSTSITHTTTNTVGGAYSCRGCGMNLRNAQGYGGHIKSCLLYKHYIKNITSSINSTPAVRPTSTQPPSVKQIVDARINNCGSNYRVQYSYSQKHDMVEEYNQWKYAREDKHLPASVALFCEWRYNENDGRKKFQINIGRWRSKNEWPKIVEHATDAEYKSFCRIPQTGKGTKFPRVEVVVYAQLKDRRRKKRKVSRKWVQITALKEFKKQYKNNDDKPSFKVSEVNIVMLCYCSVFNDFTHIIYSFITG
jgi:hypothetical protein